MSAHEAGPIETGTLALVGAGKMGLAMLEGWLKDPDLPLSKFTVIEPHPSAALSKIAADERVQIVEAAKGALEGISVMVLAVKPQVMDDVLAQVQEVAPECLIVSIAAGRTLASFEKALKTDQPIVRAMPNTPAAIGLGISVAVGNGSVSASQRDLCSALLSAVGEVAWVEDEGHLDAVTAVSGSGPAYVFHLIECLIKAGIDQGLPEDLAKQIAISMVRGSGALAAQGDVSPEQLRINVTSPNGTTAAALEVLMGAEGLQPLINKAVEAATKRSKELSG